ncbi:hypothetical protein PSHT_14126 [Puccinia striiformis]|uniref:Uncharacterized protein n=1 Tax=Puccinia striiformis TaxID=27350 RepID=A0A2S4ULT8_9BASI|nr:hypothetical protein PSHT_14126 [Puccinia striiformis]
MTIMVRAPAIPTPSPHYIYNHLFPPTATKKIAMVALSHRLTSMKTAAVPTPKASLTNWTTPTVGRLNCTRVSIFPS